MSSGAIANRAKERLAAVVVWAVAAILIALLAWILIDILVRGLSAWSWDFLWRAPADAGRSGGIGPIILSTLLILLVTLAVAGPVSLSAAVALADAQNRRHPFFRLIRRSLDVLAAVPSIVFGLFGNAFFCVTLGLGYSILSGGLTLACMILPILVQTSEQALRGVPDEYRQGAAALGLSRTTRFWRIELPVAAPALGAGWVLGIGRALAETAALLFTAGYVTRAPESLFDSGRALSVHIYDLAMNVPGGNPRAYATAAVLVFLLLGINAAAVTLTGIASGPRQMRRSAGDGQ